MGQTGQTGQTKTIAAFHCADLCIGECNALSAMPLLGVRLCRVVSQCVKEHQRTLNCSALNSFNIFQHFSNFSTKVPQRRVFHHLLSKVTIVWIWLQGFDHASRDLPLGFASLAS